MSWFRPKSLLDKTYEVGILIKGVDGLLELIGGVFLLLVHAATINKIVQFLTQRELSHDPHDFVATHILGYGHTLENGHTAFAALFLLTHGLTKIVLVASLLRNKLWAYPFALATLGLFVAYQIYRIIVSSTFGMFALTVLDTAIIWLIWREWRKVTADSDTKSSTE